MPLIHRKYLDDMLSTMNTQDIKVITGIRRSGKSTLLNEFKQYVAKNIPNANLISIDYSSLEFESLREYHALNDYVENLYNPKKRNFLLIDEAQMCDGYEKALNSFHASSKYQIYITGSNAFLSGSDLGTLFVGRTFTIEVFPFSFAEFMEYYNYNQTDHDDRVKAFKKYFREGGLAGSYPYETREKKYDYIRSIYDTMIARDIQTKYGIKNPSTLNKISDYLVDNISNLTSERKITDFLNSAKVSITNKTVGNYLQYLCDAYAFYRVYRYDIKGKYYLTPISKYYLSDHAFRYAKLGTKESDYGRVLENIVAIELLRRGYQVYTGFWRGQEIDFVAIRRDEKIYIQVAYDVDNQETMQREATPLLNIEGGYPKLLITGSHFPEYSYEGIRVLDIADWLLES